MSGQCRNGSCPRLANRMIRMDHVGDRAVCDPCIRIFEEMGVGFRVLDVAPESVPEWRKRSLAKVMAQA